MSEEKQDLYPVTPEWAALRDRLLERGGARTRNEDCTGQVLTLQDGVVVSWARYMPAVVSITLWPVGYKLEECAYASAIHVPIARYDEAEAALEALREPLMALQAKLDSFEEADNE